MSFGPTYTANRGSPMPTGENIKGKCCHRNYKGKVSCRALNSKLSKRNLDFIKSIDAQRVTPQNGNPLAFQSLEQFDPGGTCKCAGRRPQPLKSAVAGQHEQALVACMYYSSKDRLCTPEKRRYRPPCIEVHFY